MAGAFRALLKEGAPTAAGSFEAEAPPTRWHMMYECEDNSVSKASTHSFSTIIQAGIKAEASPLELVLPIQSE